MTDEPSDMNQWFINSCEEDEKRYHKLRKVYGLRPEQARDVLPNACKTEIVISADHTEWEWIFHLRHARAAHPDMRHTMGILIPLMQEAGIELDPAAIKLN
jgi:thymidylate synthase ThyX